jgi:predicted small metal-binding protein
MHVATKDGDSDRLCLSDVLQFFDEPVAFFLVVFCCPMIIKIVKDLDTTVELINKATEHAGTTHGFDRIHKSARQNVFKEVQPRIGDWHTQKHNQVFRLALDDLVFEAIKNDVVRVLSQNLVTLSFGSTVQPKEG